MSKYILANDLLGYGNENLPGQFDAVLIVRGLGPIEGYQVSGNIYFDSLGRFEDGCGVRTSTVKEILPLSKSYYLIKTNNTTYLCTTD